MSDSPTPSWPVGAATGVGSLPGTDVDDAVRFVFDELPDFPHLPELPNRGHGADMIGRAAAMLVELHVDLQPAGWRLLPGGAGPGLDERRAEDFLRRDLDALEAHAFDYRGPLKLSFTGPWTLAAAVELPRGGAALVDPGAARDLTEALTEGILRAVADVRLRIPGAQLFVQLDEPGLPAVLAGRVPTASGFGTVPRVEAAIAADRLAGLMDALGAAGTRPGLHCCAPRPPLAVFRRARPGFLSFDAGGADLDLDSIGEAVEDGVALLLGVVPGTDRGAAGPAGNPPELSDPSRTVEPARRLWRRLGFVPERLGEVVAVSPTCGMAGASAPYPAAALKAVRAAARLLVEEPA